MFERGQVATAIRTRFIVTSLRICKSATKSNARVKANVPTIRLSLDRRQHRKGFGRFRQV
jgi:hypothetical protein